MNKAIKKYRVVGTRGNTIELNAPSKGAAARAVHNLMWFGPVVDVIDPDAPARVAQNAQCPCGSGKKYKRCCGKRG